MVQLLLRALALRDFINGEGCYRKPSALFAKYRDSSERRKKIWRLVGQMLVALPSIGEQRPSSKGTGLRAFRCPINLGALYKNKHGLLNAIILPYALKTEQSSYEDIWCI